VTIYKKLVLTIDDDPVIRSVLRAILEESGYEVIEAEDGGHGLSLARLHDPDLILMDINMPTLSGWDATAFLRSLDLTSDVPIIAVTNQDLSGDGARMRELGFSGYVSKTDLPLRLADTVRTALRMVEDASDWVGPMS
jgi:two-component system cell cycle response regulator DivK